MSGRRCICSRCAPPVTVAETGSPPFPIEWPTEADAIIDRHLNP